MRAVPDVKKEAGSDTGKPMYQEGSMNATPFPGRGWIVVAAALAIGAAACGTAKLDKAGGPVSKPVVLTLADGEGDLSNAQPFVSAVRNLSHGTLQIKIEGDWRHTDPNYETGLIKDVRAGKAQLGITTSRAFDTVGIDSFQALQAPFLIDSYPLERKVLGSGIPAKMLAGLRPYGLVGLGILPGPLRRPLGFGRPLLAASNYQGARIGIRPSRVTADIFRALGAIPDTQTRSSSGMSITRGLTGFEGPASIIDSGFAIPGAILTGNVVFEPRPNVIFMNQRAFGSLTPGERGLLLRAAAKARSAGIYQGNDLASVADLCRRGIKIVSASPADLAGLRAAVQPVYRALDANPSAKTFIEEIAAMRQAAGDSASTVTCPSAAATGGISGSAAMLQGTWQVTYTQSELAAAGADPNELGPPLGNFGQLTLKLSQGHWWWRNTGGDPAAIPSNKYAYGTYVVTGSKIKFYRRDNAYPGSDTEIWGPYIWSVYRDALTFKKAGWTGSTQGPTGLAVRPWRTSGT
jgi:TRAP-type C4-dicarboxylate transport system substrate-binding protein